MTRTLKLALRTLSKSPFVTSIAVLSLGLGIGANAAIYSLFDQMLLRPLPVREPQRLVNLETPGPKAGAQSWGRAGEMEAIFSYPMFRDLERIQTAFSGLAAHWPFGANLSFRQQPMSGDGLLVSGSYFATLGLEPALGRLLTREDDRRVGGDFVAVLSHSFWTSRFGGDRSVLNQTITVNGLPMMIVGVAPRGFEGTTLGRRPLVFAPITMRGAVMPSFTGEFDTNRRHYWVYLFARLRPDGSIEQARAAINRLYRPIIKDIEAPLQQGMSEQTLARFKAREIRVEPGLRGQSTLHSEARTPLWLLFGLTGIVLLIACANIANLLLVRGASRGMEMAVRLALGAERRQLLVQLLTESVVLAVMGGMASLLIATLTLAGMETLLPPSASSSLRFELEGSVVRFAALLSIGTGLVFGMFPALNSTRLDLVTSIRANAGQISGGARTAARFRSALVTAQVALSMALLVSAGLFVKSLRNVGNVDLGMQLDNVVTFAISPGRSGYDGPRAQALFDRVESELAAIPGVTAVTSSFVPVLAGTNSGGDVLVQGFTAGPDIDSHSKLNYVGAGYFSALGIPLQSGRELSRADVGGATPVAVVNEEFTKKFHLGREAVGKFIAANGSGPLDIQIVGVVKNAKYSEVKKPVPPLFFLAWHQEPRLAAMNFYVRSSRRVADIERAIPPLLEQLGPGVPVEGLKTMAQQIKENVYFDRMISILSASFAALATLLAGVGLYGVLAYTVAQRTREIGVRLALGADAQQVHRMVMRQVGGTLLVGGAIGVAASLVLGRAAGSLLFGLEAHDPLVFVLAGVVLMIVAFAAGYVPARRAARVDPMQALRYE